MSETLARLFRHAVSYDKPDAMLAKSGGKYRPISSREMYRRVGRLFWNLKKVGVNRGDRCALLAENRWEWAVADFAMMASGIVSVPIYPTLTAEQVQYLLDHSESRIVFVSSQIQLEKVRQVWDHLPRLEGVIAFDNVHCDDDRVIVLDSLLGDKKLSQQETEDFEAALAEVAPENLASIIYTSGTTGTPKGVMLTHGNFSSNVRDCGIEIRPTDVCLSFLPLCHVAERTADYAYFYNGATVAYAESIETVPQNFQEVRPMIAVGVPRFFEKIHGKVMTTMAAAPPLKRKMFEWAVKVGEQTTPYRLQKQPIPGGLKIQQLAADLLVLRKLRNRLGGRLRMFISGAAPLARHLAEFFWAVGMPIYEAYGLTETSPLVSINTPRHTKFGTVGRLIRNVDVRIADDGEIWVRGLNIMKGYYKMPEDTAAVLEKGWLATGDIGKIDQEGYLSITDRKKDLFKTSGGKFIAPQPIENLLKTSPYISTAVVVAEGRKFPSALLVPDFDRVRRWVKEHDVRGRGMQMWLEDQRVKQFIEEEAEKACAGLPQYERPKKFIILNREFTIEDGEMTPTMKVRRRAVEMKFSRQIEALYEEES